MAEFEQVARGWKRMCKQYWTTRSCAGCPIAEHWQMYKYCKEHMPDNIDFKMFEELVMKWVAEHPEPVYPTWYEYLSDYYGAAFGDMHVIGRQPIPADIAEKLGIKPKKVTNDG